jgi:hypothetical protein
MTHLIFEMNDPYAVILAADARLSTPDYCNDHAWVVNLRGGEPPCLALQTTFGLRARSMRLFAQFSEASVTASDPAAFHQAPKITQFFPNFAKIVYAPFSGIDVTASYWVPTSNVLAVRFQVTNGSILPRQFKMEVAVVLSPLGEGAGMAPFYLESAPGLAGTTSDLRPVLLMSGSPRHGSGSFPALEVEVDLKPASTQDFYCVLAARSDAGASAAEAQAFLARSWEAEFARIEMVNMRDTVEISSGNREWDQAFACSQAAAFQLVMPGQSTLDLPHPSIVSSRQPDQGFSRRLDGSDYDYLWNGQTALDVYYLTNFLLPGAYATLQGLIYNFLHSQQENGEIDWKPGLAGQRGHLAVTPVLCAITWKIFQASKDKAFLEAVFPGLLKYLGQWFQPVHDADRDGYPELDHFLQVGFDANPADHPQRTRPALSSVRYAESPALGAFLYHDIRCLEKIAQQLGHARQAAELSRRADHLKKAVEGNWNQKDGVYQYCDRSTHRAPKGERLLRAACAAEVAVKRKFPQPARLEIVLSAEQSPAAAVEVVVRGTTPAGKAEERLNAGARSQAPSSRTYWTENTYLEVESIACPTPWEGALLEVYTQDFRQEDISLLLPLWAQIPGTQKAKNLVQKNLAGTGRYLRLFGLPNCPAPVRFSREDRCGAVSPLWNMLIIEGLLRYDFRKEAAEIFTRLAAGIVQALKDHHSFSPGFDCDQGTISGEKNSLQGLAPAGLFLELVGIHFLSANSLIVTGFSPFSGPITVKYHGTTVTRNGKETHIVFPDGQSLDLHEPGSFVVSLA